MGVLSDDKKEIYSNCLKYGLVQILDVLDSLDRFIKKCPKLGDFVSNLSPKLDLKKLNYIGTLPCV